MYKAPPNYEKMSPDKGVKFASSTMDSIVREVGQQLNSIISARLFVPVGGIKETS